MKSRQKTLRTELASSIALLGIILFLSDSNNFLTLILYDTMQKIISTIVSLEFLLPTLKAFLIGLTALLPLRSASIISSFIFFLLYLGPEHILIVVLLFPKGVVLFFCVSLLQSGLGCVVEFSEK